MSTLGRLTVTLLDEATRGDSYSEIVMTDAQGRFFFDTMPVGNYVVTIEVNGQDLEEPVNASDEHTAGVTFGISNDALNGQMGNEPLPNSEQNHIFVPFLGFE